MNRRLTIRSDRSYEARHLWSYLPDDSVSDLWTVYIGQIASKDYIIISQFFLFRMFNHLQNSSNGEKPLRLWVSLKGKDTTTAIVRNPNNPCFQIRLVPLSKRQYATILLTVTPKEFVD